MRTKHRTAQALSRLPVTVVAATIVALSGAMPVAAASVMPESSLVGIPGRYVLPEKNPTQLVIFAHGHDNSSASWVGHLQDAARHGAVAVAPDYRGLGGAPDYGGWPANAGAEDLVTSARFFLNRCPSIKQVFLLGVSMGGNMSGLALAAKPTRPDGTTPLFDYWVDVEGVNDLTQEYLLARAVGLTGNTSGTVAQAEIEAETGGPVESKPGAYQSRTNILRGPDIAASGVKGAILVHAAEDGLVPSDQSVTMTGVLRGNGVPTDLYAVVRRGQERDPGHDQTTVLSDAGQGESDPFAGHGWEGSNTHIVINTGLQKLYRLMDASTARPSNQNYLVDYGLGVVPASDVATNPSPVGQGPSSCVAPPSAAGRVPAPSGRLPLTSAPIGPRPSLPLAIVAVIGLAAAIRYWRGGPRPD